MMPIGLSMMEPTHRRNDAQARELRGYVRREYGAELPWLLSRLPRPRPPLRRLLRLARARFGGTRAVDTNSAPASVREPAPPRPVPAPRPWPASERPDPVPTVSAECLHLVREDIGEVGVAAVTRCVACGLVFVEQPGRVWAIASPDRAASPATPAARELPLLGPLGT